MTTPAWFLMTPKTPHSKSEIHVIGNAGKYANQQTRSLFSWMKRQANNDPARIWSAHAHHKPLMRSHLDMMESRQNVSRRSFKLIRHATVGHFFSYIGYNTDTKKYT